MNNLHKYIDEAYQVNSQTEGFKESTNSPLLSDWYNNAMMQLEEIQAECKNKGWDGYIAEPISERLITLGKQLIYQIQHSHVGTISDISPSSQEEIVFEFESGKGHSQIMTLNNESKLFIVDHEVSENQNVDEIQTFEGSFSGISLPIKARKILKP